MIQALVRNYRIHKALLVGMLVFMYVPIFLLILVSFNVDPYSLFPYQFTTQNYLEVFTGQYNEPLWNSLQIGFGSGFISMAVGAASAWGVTRYDFRFRYAVATLFVLPLVVPTLITGIGSALVHDQLSGLSGSVTLAMLTQSLRGTAFAFLIMMAQLNQYPVELDRAAKVYGATDLQRFKEVTLPLIWGALLGAFLIPTIIAFNDYNLTFFTVGSSSTIPTVTFAQMKFGLNASLFALSSIVAIVSLALVFGSSLFLKFSGIGESSGE